MSNDIDAAQVQIQILEGSFVELDGTIGDDFQVRHVELLVDGNVVLNDVNFPFDLGFPTPNLKLDPTV